MHHAAHYGNEFWATRRRQIETGLTAEVAIDYLHNIPLIWESPKDHLIANHAKRVDITPCIDLSIGS
jgi:hypothetical protein